MTDSQATVLTLALSTKVLTRHNMIKLFPDSSAFNGTIPASVKEPGVASQGIEDADNKANHPPLIFSRREL